MDKFLNLSVSGLVTGAIYSIMASGLVLTYTTSGIFNFAHGAVAFATAYLYYQLNTGVGIPIVPSVIIAAFVFAPLLGLLLDRILLRRLAKAPVYARIVGTIGLLVMLPALVQWFVVALFIGVFHWDLPGNLASTEGIPVPGIGPSPANYYNPFGGVVMSSDQLAVFAVATVAAVVLWYVIRRTRLGLEMRAVVDREQLAGLRGVNAARTSAAAWVMTMILAGIGGILIAPLFTLADTVYTLVVLGALAVVVLGRLRSIPIAFIGGLGLGVVQNLVAGYSTVFLPKFLTDLSGLKAAVPFILTVVLLLVLGRERGRRAGSVADDLPRPDHRHGMSALRRRLPWVIWTLILIVYSQQWLPWSWIRAGTYEQTILAQGLAVAIIFLSFVVVTGMGGMVSLAQATFVTAGGFAAGWTLSRDWGVDIPGVIDDGKLNFGWAALIGLVVAGAVGFVIALPMTRLGGVNIALGTLACAFIASLIVFPIRAIGNGQGGWPMPQPTFDIPVLNQIVDLLVIGSQDGIDTSLLSVQVLLFLSVFGLVTLTIHALQRSASGRAILAVRSSEVAAEASGIRVQRTKIMFFAFSAAIAGLGGVMLGLFSFQVSNSTAPPLTGLFWLALAVTFGIRRPGGALIAGLAFTCALAVFNAIADLLPGETVTGLVTSPYFVPILSGIGAIQLAQEPDGILALNGQQKLQKQRDQRRNQQLAAMAEDRAAESVVVDGSVAAVPANMPVGTAEPTALHVLELRGIVAGYGDVEVLHGVDLRLDRGAVVALLGANGAGKSTLCGVTAGLVAPTFGSVHLAGEDVTVVAPFQRARSGVLVVPEARGIFPGLTVEENLVLTVPDAADRAKAYDRFPILYTRRKLVAGLLSGGEQQMLSLAPALAHPPTVLVADEPTLGLAPLLADMVMEAVLELRDQGCAVLLVEEHAKNALKVADTLAFMELGRIVWTGPREEADLELLSSAYLGSHTTASLV
jgi:ABC-type branched-subunit amino acid transport system ATPase component/branched-subunit amino acid ABC-type transport system permease component